MPAACIRNVFNRGKGWYACLTALYVFSAIAVASPTLDARRVPNDVTMYVSIEGCGEIMDTLSASPPGRRIREFHRLMESAKWWNEMTAELGPDSDALFRSLLEQRVTFVERPLSESDQRRIEAAINNEELRVQLAGEDSQWLLIAHTERTTIRKLMKRVKPDVVRWLDGRPVYSMWNHKAEMAFDGGRMYLTSSAFPGLLDDVLTGEVEEPLSRSADFRQARGSGNGRVMFFARDRGNHGAVWEVIFADTVANGVNIHHHAHSNDALFNWSGDDAPLDAGLLTALDDDGWLLSVDRVMPVELDDVDFAGFAAEMLRAVRNAFTPLLDTLDATSFTLMSTDRDDDSDLLPTLVWGVEVKDLDDASREADRLLSGVLVAGRLAMAANGVTLELPDAWPEDPQATRHVDLTPMLAALRKDRAKPGIAETWTTDLNLAWFGVRRDDRAWWLIGTDAAMLERTRTRLLARGAPEYDPNLISTGAVDASRFATLVSRWCEAVPVDQPKDRDIAHAVCEIIEATGDLKWTLRRRSEHDMEADVTIRWRALDQ